MIRVLICDDHQIVRQGIKQILADASDLALAGEAASGPEAIARVRPFAVDASSRLEREPGIKDGELIRKFVEAVRRS